MELLSIEEAADMLRAHVGTMRHWRALRVDGYPHGFKIGKRLVYDKAEIVEFVERQKAAS